MARSVTIVGLDCGSTTSCLVVASGRLVTGALGRVDVSEVAETYRSETIFTPFDGPRIDAARLSKYLDGWLSAAGVASEEIFSGGALITGLAAQRENAAAIRELFRLRLADAVVAAADAPRLEAWLSFMGNCQALSEAHPRTPILNLDIGGGTTNLALGIDGQVLATGSLFVGARHFQCEPGSYRLCGLASLASELLQALKIDRGIGDELSSAQVGRIVDFYLRQLVAAITGEATAGNDPLAIRHVQAPFVLPELADRSPAITLSGGVGQLVYRLRASGERPGPTVFGDLGGELALAILNCPALADRLQLMPEGLGHATVFGLLRHSTEVSGATLFLPDPGRLPLADVPLVGSVNRASTGAEIAELLNLVAAAGRAGAVQVELALQNLDDLRHVGEALASSLAARPLPRGTTLVLLVNANLGKTLGHYLTRWGKLDVDLIVIDEISPRDAQFVRLGRLRETVVPLWLYAVR